MIQMDQSTADYLHKLLIAQDIPGLMIRMRAVDPGTLKADCRLEFCEPEELGGKDCVIENEKFSIVIDQLSMRYLEDTELSYQQTATGGQMVVKAPHLKAKALAENATLLERIQHLLENEINPQVAAHGGHVSLLELRADYTAVLQFGGGCQGCGMKDVTLKQGIEKSLLSQIPELRAVVDATDHAAGTNPYFRG